VRIIWGEQDRWLEPGIAHKLQGMIPGAEVEMIPEAGHFVMEDAPEGVLSILSSFFSGRD
jgi:pimeloyl-ACP methyl ester carboxylesterase